MHEIEASSENKREIKGKIKSPENKSAKHDVNWLRDNGICLNNISVKKSTNGKRGWGVRLCSNIFQFLGLDPTLYLLVDVIASSARVIPKGSVVAPVVHTLDHRSMEVIRVKDDPNTGGSKGGSKIVVSQALFLSQEFLFSLIPLC